MDTYLQTAIEQALAAEALDAGASRPLPFLLAGPVVRRAEPEGVWIWFACSREITSCTPRVTVYDSAGHVNDTLANDNGWYPLAARPDLRVARLGERLWVAMVKAEPRSRPFPRGWFYGYELTIGSRDFTTTLAGQGLHLAYAPFRLPTFVLGLEAQRLVHGSCRRPGAPGPDAYPAFDAWLTTPQRDPMFSDARTYRPIADTTRRPTALILTGDQIYADDVALPLFRAVQRLARDLFGYVEQLPAWDGRGTVSVDTYLPPQPGRPPAPGSGSHAAPGPDSTPMERRRKWLTALPHSPIGFTTDDGEAHLLSFPEFAAMYLLVLNEQLCHDYGVDDGTVPELAGFPAAVGASRRVLANMATYMVFDDHEITDDWNLDDAWVRATANPMARRVIANGLAAYWAFQGWGNDPEQFEPLRGAIGAQLAAMRGAAGRPAAPAAAFDRELLGRHWSFVAPTSPPALCVDTRTSREFPPGKTAVLSGPKVWPHLTTLARRHRLRKGAPLLIVLPTPLLAHRSMTFIQARKYRWPQERYEGDYELYINNPRQRSDLIRYLRSGLDPPAVVVFSGDVHHGSVVSGLYVGGAGRAAIDSGKGTWGLRIAQVTSSPIKNVKKDAYVDKKLIVTDAGNVGESVISQYETLYDEPPGGEAVGVRADVVNLDGPLGRRTFVWENHLCVVDVPEAAGGDVRVLFVGNKDGSVRTATTSLSTRNDPRTFEPSPATRIRQQLPHLPRAAELGYMHTAIEDALGATWAASGRHATEQAVATVTAPAIRASHAAAPGAQDLGAVAFAAVTAGEADVPTVALLAEHHDVGPDMILRWSEIADLSAGVDVVVHLHGFSRDRRLNLRGRKLGVSGLDFVPPPVPAGSGAPAQPAWTGRRRPTLLVLPRGRARPDHAAAYDFPALTRPHALAQLIEAALREFEGRAGIGRSVAARRIIITAHSGGGAALDAILAHTADTSVDPHEVHVFDALYGTPSELRAWVGRRLRRDVERLRAGVADPAGAMSTDGGALRILYLHGEERATTRPGSLAVQAAAHDLIPRGTAYTGLLERRYRTEVSRIGHALIPYWYGGRLLADVTADVPGP